MSSPIDPLGAQDLDTVRHDLNQAREIVRAANVGADSAIVAAVLNAISARRLAASIDKTAERLARQIER